MTEEKSTVLRGEIGRITFFNPENHYTIARFTTEAGQPVTITGILPDVTPGTLLTLSGSYVRHPKYGDQFKITSHEVRTPETLAGIEKYLGSGLIKGVGPVMAKLLVKQFGESTLDIIENEPEKLKKVPGFGQKRVAMIKSAVEGQKEMRGIMVFLQGHGVSTGYAVKIYRHYGKDALTAVQQNPYRLASDIQGIGFMIADSIARKLGLPKDSPERAKAGVMHVLSSMAEEGHVFYPYLELVDKCAEILSLEKDIILKGFTDLFERREIIIEDMNENDEDCKPDNKAVYLGPFHTAETGIAKRFNAVLSSPSRLKSVSPEQALAWVKAEMEIELEETQMAGVRTALASKAMVLTGGPGTGKTTLVRAILAVLSKMTPGIALAAPTGRAAKRLSETTGRPALTLHRLLEWDFGRRGFSKGADNPLAADVIIIDEASMIDSLLMYHLLKAVPDTAVLILVGDVDQLPSVGPGNVFRDIILSGRLPVVKLTRIFRQAAESLIITNAHRINEGEFPQIPEGEGGEKRDFYFIERAEDTAIQETVADLVIRRIPEGFGFNPLREIQVLTPMNKGTIGTVALNGLLQGTLNPHGKPVQAAGRAFRQGDRVMQIVNNYDKDVYNGDMGSLELVDEENRTAAVRFEGRIVEYDLNDLDELVLCYAVSVHKSQGSEYPAVVIPLHTSHYMLLQRNLLYTALTRAKKLCVLVGSKKAICMAIKNDKVRKRFTRLRKRLEEASLTA